MKRSKLIELRTMIEKASASLTDTDALEAKELFPNWEVGKAYAVGDRFAYYDTLYKVLQPHTSQVDWPPDVTPSLYTEVAKGGQGDDPSNPIPYNNNMELIKDKYYSQYEKVYLCFRNTEIPVYNDLKDLVGLYVEEYVGGNE